MRIVVGISCEDRKHRTLGDLQIHNLEFKNWARKKRERDIKRGRERERESEREGETDREGGREKEREREKARKR